MIRQRRRCAPVPLTMEQKIQMSVIEFKSEGSKYCTPVGVINRGEIACGEQDN
jgi:hypothetical protein